AKFAAALWGSSGLASWRRDCDWAAISRLRLWTVPVPSPVMRATFVVPRPVVSSRALQVQRTSPSLSHRRSLHELRMLSIACRESRSSAASAIAIGYGRMHPSITCAEPNIAFDRTEERSPSGGVPPRQLPMRADDVAGVAVRIAFQVILVLGLR